MEGLLQPTHLIFILIIVLVIFGPGKLPDLGRSLGKGIREFKEAMRGGIDNSNNSSAQPPPVIPAATVKVASEPPGAPESEKTVEQGTQVKVK